MMPNNKLENTHLVLSYKWENLGLLATNTGATLHVMLLAL